MVLGTSAYKNGIRATTFRAEIDAGLGYLVGAAAQPQVVRTFYLNLPDTERVAKRARALREAAGTLSGVALGQDDTTPQRDVLADAAEVLAGATGMHWQPLADRLAERFPERWAEATGEAVRAELGARGVPSVVVVMERHAGPRLPRRRRRQGGERHMTPAADAHNCYRPDLRRDRKAVTAVTGPPALTSGNTNHSTGPEMTEAPAPWGSPRARKPSTVTSRATTSGAIVSRAASTARATTPGTRPGSRRATPKAARTATPRATRTAQQTRGES